MKLAQGSAGGHHIGLAGTLVDKITVNDDDVGFLFLIRARLRATSFTVKGRPHMGISPREPPGVTRRALRWSRCSPFARHGWPV